MHSIKFLTKVGIIEEAKKKQLIEEEVPKKPAPNPKKIPEVKKQPVQ